MVILSVQGIYYSIGTVMDGMVLRFRLHFAQITCANLPATRNNLFVDPATINNKLRPTRLVPSKLKLEFQTYLALLPRWKNV